MRAFAVPPVERSRTPKATRPHAKSTSPVLSETESSACEIGAVMPRNGRTAAPMDYRIPYLESFDRRVLRFSPSMSAA